MIGTAWITTSSALSPESLRTPTSSSILSAWVRSNTRPHWERNISNSVWTFCKSFNACAIFSYVPITVLPRISHGARMGYSLMMQRGTTWWNVMQRDAKLCTWCKIIQHELTCYNLSQPLRFRRLEKQYWHRRVFFGLDVFCSSCRCLKLVTIDCCCVC